MPYNLVSDNATCFVSAVIGTQWHSAYYLFAIPCCVKLFGAESSLNCEAWLEEGARMSS